MQAGSRTRKHVSRVTGEISGKSVTRMACSTMSWFQPWCCAIKRLTLRELGGEYGKPLSYFCSFLEV